MKTTHLFPFFYRLALLLCPVVSLSLAQPATVSITTVPSLGRVPTQPSHTSVSNYGINPLILLTPNPDNSFDVAYFRSDVRRIQILMFNSAGTLANRLEPDALLGAQSLLGLARIPSDSSFVVAYSKPAAIDTTWRKYEYWITRISKTGAQVFSTQLFGDKHKDSLNAKGEPGTFSSGRIAYNAERSKIAFYTGHTMKWSDGIRHQGGYFGFMSLTGTFVVTDGWYFSHNFDQRLLVDGANYYTLAHGDAFPRALGITKWEDAGTSGRKLFNKVYYSIPGTVGDNSTKTQTGNFVKLANGNFGVVYTTANHRARHDVCYRQINLSGDTISKTWLTEFPQDTFAIFPRIACFDTTVLVLWEEVVGATVTGVRTIVLKSDGTPMTARGSLTDKNVRLSPFYEVSTLPNGDVVWVNGKGTDSLSIFRISATGATLSVTYNGNTNTGGTAPIDPLLYQAGGIVTVPGAGTLVKTGHTFAGWNREANGTGKNYAAGDTLVIGTANVTLYARWTTNPTFTITYDGNDHTGGTVPTDGSNYETGAAVTISGNTGSLVKTGHTFAGWNREANGTGKNYAAGDTLVIGTANVTLYARWQTVTYTLTLRTSTGGRLLPTGTVSVAYGANTPIRAIADTGYHFVKWQTVSGAIHFADSTKDSTTVQLTAGDGEITALFARDSYTLTIARKTDTDSATVYKDTTALHGDTLRLTAMPVSGAQFVVWRITAGKATITDSSAQTTGIVLRNGSATITAFYTKISGIASESKTVPQVFDFSFNAHRGVFLVSVPRVAGYSASRVKLTLFDLRGRTVMRTDKLLHPGHHDIRLVSDGHTAGCFWVLCRMEAPGFTKTARVLTGN